MAINGLLRLFAPSAIFYYLAIPPNLNTRTLTDNTDHMKKVLLSLAAFAFALTAAAADPAAQAYEVSFLYDGQPFSPETWQSSEKTTGPLETETAYISPDGRLKVTITRKTYPDFPVKEIRTALECLSDEGTGIIEDFRSLRFSREYNSTGYNTRGVKVRRTNGSRSEYTDFCRHDVFLQPRPECDTLEFSSGLGRTTDWIPYFGIDFDSLHGLEIAVGWTGTWRAGMHLDKEFRLNVGMGQRTHFRMLPGECFCMPYVVIYERDGQTVEDGLVGFHRFVIAHKAPRDSKGNLFKPILPLTAAGGNKTDENLLKVIDKATAAFPDIPFDTFWVDAGWYGTEPNVPQEDNCGPHWYAAVGNWHPNPAIHPEGNLRKIAEAANRKGMRFLLWFEPERATHKTAVVNEHPEYFIQRKINVNPRRFLIDYTNPDAVAWMKAEVVRNIEESGVQVYRQDFNVDPLFHWRENDTPDRLGVTEIQTINGLWDYWEWLRRKYPDMPFDCCAGGGGRIDIHIMSYAHAYCRDDAQMFEHPEELAQIITLNSTPYLPFTAGDTFTVPPFDTYGFLSCMAATTVFSPPAIQGMFLNRDPSAKEIAWYTKLLKTADRFRDYFFGDFYALTHEALDGPDIYAGYQLNLPDKGEGFYMVFRRESCPDDSFNLRLRAIDPKATYRVEDFDGKVKRMKGSALATQVLSFPEPRSYKLVFYKKL